MKNYLCFVLLLCVLVSVCGCKTTYIDESKNKQNTVIDTTEDETQQNEYPKETHEQSKLPSVSAGAGIKYLSDENDSVVQEQKSEYVISKGLNCVGVTISCKVNEVLLWSDITAKIYVIDNGVPIPFSVDGLENTGLYMDVDYTVGKNKNIVIKFEQEHLSSQNGRIDILVYFNPDEQVGEWSGMYTGMVICAFNYINNYYLGEDDKGIEKYEGEYLQIPDEYIDNATVHSIGDCNLYNDEFVVKRYENNLLQCSNTGELFIYWNGRSYEEVLVGLIVDGELKKISGENYFIRIEQKNGTQTFKYPLDVLGELEKGEHTFTLIGLEGDLGCFPGNRVKVIIK